MKVECVNRKAEIIVPPNNRGWKHTLRSCITEEALYLFIGVTSCICIDFGVNAITKLLYMIFLVSVTGGFYLLKSVLFAKKKAVAAGKKTKSPVLKSDPTRLRHERRTISCLSIAGRIAHIRLVNKENDNADFTSFTPAIEPRRLGMKIVFCVELSHGSYSWHVWRSLGQFVALRPLLVAAHGELAVPILSFPELPSSEDLTQLASIESFSRLCQKTADLWLSDVLRCGSEPVVNDSDFRQFLGMGPYSELSAVLDETGASSLVVTASEKGTAIVNGEISANRYSKGTFWQGSNLDDFEFLDETDTKRNLYLDCSFSHNFKIRGLTYSADKRKVDAGSPICKMIMLEIFEAQPEDGERIDHISARGVVRERISIINSLPGNPFVLVLNIQIPGDPPVSIVSYFAVPPDLREKMTSQDDKKFIKMLDQFFDMPRNEAERLAAWGVESPTINPDCNGEQLSSVDAVLRGVDRPQTSSVRSGRSADSTNDEALSGSEDCHGEAGDLDDPGDDTDGETGTSGSRLGLGIKIPSLRKMISTRRPKHSDNTALEPASPARCKDNGSVRSFNEFNEGTPKRKGILSRSLQRISSFRGFTGPGKHKSGELHDEAAANGLKADDGIAAESSQHRRRPSRFQELGLAEDEQRAMLNVETASTNSARESTVSTARTESVSGQSATPGLPPVSRKQNLNPKGPMGLPSDIAWPSPDEPGALPMDDFRNQRFKLIPVITDGPWVVKMAVRSTPVLLGQKVVQRYFRGDNYMEIDVHVGSSIIAAQIVGVCRSYTKSYATNLGIVIQGNGEEELPERLLACITFNKLDLDIRSKL